MESLQACPLTLGHPSEAQQLHGFGPKLCDRLAEKLKSHCEQNGLPVPKPSRTCICPLPPSILQLADIT